MSPPPHENHIINESALKTPSSNLTIFYFKIGQPASFDLKNNKPKNKVKNSELNLVHF